MPSLVAHSDAFDLVILFVYFLFLHIEGFSEPGTWAGSKDYYPAGTKLPTFAGPTDDEVAWKIPNKKHEDRPAENSAPQVTSNLVLGTKEANSQMVTYERFISNIIGIQGRSKEIAALKLKQNTATVVAKTIPLCGAKQSSAPGWPLWSDTHFHTNAPASAPTRY